MRYILNTSREIKIEPNEDCFRQIEEMTDTLNTSQEIKIEPNEDVFRQIGELQDDLTDETHVANNPAEESTVEAEERYQQAVTVSSGTSESQYYQ